jgi:hypothetical protein
VSIRPGKGLSCRMKRSSVRDVHRSFDNLSAIAIIVVVASRKAHCAKSC